MSYPVKTPSGYLDFGPRVVANRPACTNPRPHCDMCGPFANRLMRVLFTDEIGPVYRCEECDAENGQ